jgi:hypothetical protein
VEKPSIKRNRLGYGSDLDVDQKYIRKGIKMHDDSGIIIPK